MFSLGFLIYVVADDMCVLEIGTSGVGSDIASWRDFWEIGVAINGMCIREGRQGFQINIGIRIDSAPYLEW